MKPGQNGLERTVVLSSPCWIASLVTSAPQAMYDAVYQPLLYHHERGNSRRNSTVTKCGEKSAIKYGCPRCVNTGTRCIDAASRRSAEANQPTRSKQRRSVVSLGKRLAEMVTFEVRNGWFCTRVQPMAGRNLRACVRNAQLNSTNLPRNHEDEARGRRRRRPIASA